MLAEPRPRPCLWSTPRATEVPEPMTAMHKVNTDSDFARRHGNLYAHLRAVRGEFQVHPLPSCWTIKRG